MEQHTKNARPSRVLLAGVVIGALVAGAALGWAGSVVFAPATTSGTGEAFTFATVEEGSVGAAITLNTVANWTLTPAGTNRSSGIVTSVASTSSEPFNSGDELFAVDLRPVVIGMGAVPAFRSIAPGDRGPDVEQLQRLLSDVGTYDGSESGIMDQQSVAALRSWQKIVGVPVDGVLRQADVIWVPELPAAYVVDPALISVGATVSGGESIISSVGVAPNFYIPVTPAQAAFLSTGLDVAIEAPDGGTWDASIAEQATDADGSVRLRLSAPTPDGIICGASCAVVPTSGEALLRSRVNTVPEVAGLVVPTATLGTKPNGDVFVVDGEGTEHVVTVIAGASGESVVEGLSAGMRLRVPGDRR